MIDEKNKGRRVELVFTNDPYTTLKAGDKGTYEYANIYRIGEKTETQHCIKWDCGSNLMLIEGVDRFKFIDN